MTARSPVRLAGAGNDVTLDAGGGRRLRLTNLRKPFWPDRGITKGDLLQYYADVAELLLPHVRDRAMVMKRYPNGWRGKVFWQKRTPDHAPEWLETCSIEHGSGSVIDFPMVQDLPALLWVINLGCIDLNPWYSRCDDPDRPDVLHFDLDPGDDTPFEKVAETALLVRAMLESLGMPTFIKTTGGSGMHLYVPIARGPTQKQVWTFAKAVAQTVAQERPKLATAQYTVAKRPKGTVFVDYNQNAWGQTLASIYSVRPVAEASVSTPLRWDEVERGVRPEDFRLDNVRERFGETGDLWRPVTWPTKGRFDLGALL